MKKMKAEQTQQTWSFETFQKQPLPGVALWALGAFSPVAAPCLRADFPWKAS